MLCNTADLPGMVVRSIAACYTYKMDELAVPDGLHERILESTIGTAKAADVKASWARTCGEWVRGLRFPIADPAACSGRDDVLLAFLVFSQTVSADGSLHGVYKQGVELAEQTYQQSADAWAGKPANQRRQQQTRSTAHYVNQRGQIVMNCAYHIQNGGRQLQRLRTAALPGVRSPHQGISRIARTASFWASIFFGSRTNRIIRSVREETNFASDSTLLSFICPGLGAAYNGQTIKALVYFAVFVGLFQMAVLTGGTPLFVFGFMGMWFSRHSTRGGRPR